MLHTNGFRYWCFVLAVGFAFLTTHVGRQLVISRVHKLCMAYLWAVGGGSNKKHILVESIGNMTAKRRVTFISCKSRERERIFSANEVSEISVTCVSQLKPAVAQLMQIQLCHQSNIFQLQLKDCPSSVLLYCYPLFLWLPETCSCSFFNHFFVLSEWRRTLLFWSPATLHKFWNCTFPAAKEKPKKQELWTERRASATFARKYKSINFPAMP